MSDPSAIAAALVGVPYQPFGRSRSAADCWGICLMAGRMAGIEFPEYFFDEAELLEQAQHHIANETVPGSRWLRVDKPPYALGTIHIFRIMGLATHTGFHLKDDLFLSSLAGRNAVVETFDSSWRLRHCGSFQWNNNSLSC